MKSNHAAPPPPPPLLLLLLPLLSEMKAPSTSEAEKLRKENAALRSKLAASEGKKASKKDESKKEAAALEEKRAAELEELQELERETRQQELDMEHHLDLKEQLKEDVVVKISYGCAPCPVPLCPPLPTLPGQGREGSKLLAIWSPQHAEIAPNPGAF